ncbi:MAG TPA: hypothetical protein VK206_25485 [Anaerolineales bacterium]|nr:hypothetical protein [Anaerolineales bacterium]
MRTFGQVFAAICAVLFVISSVVILLLFNIEQKAFSSETYKQAFENQRLYERMPEILATALTEYLAENGSAVPFLQILKVEDWQNSITLLLPPEELKTISDNALDATFDYLNGKTNSIIISLVPVKVHLASESGIQVVLQILSRQPACTPEQLAQMATGLFGGEITLCNPPEQAIGLMMPFIQTQVQSMTALLPDEVTLLSSAGSDTATDPRRKLNAVRSAIKLTPFIPLLFLFGIAVFAVRNLLDWLTWWGWPLMFAGGMSVLIGLFGSPVIGGILQLLIRTQGSFLIPPVLASSIAETASAVARQMLAPVVFEGFVIGFIGLGMVILAMFLPKRAIDQII